MNAFAINCVVIGTMHGFAPSFYQISVHHRTAFDARLKSVQHVLCMSPAFQNCALHFKDSLGVRMSGQYNTMRRVLQGSCDETTPSCFFVMSLSAFMLHYSISFFSPVAVCRPDHAPSLPQTPAWRHAPIEFGPVLVWSWYFHLPLMCARFIESFHLTFFVNRSMHFEN